MLVAHLMHMMGLLNWIISMLHAHGAHHPSFGCISNSDCNVWTKHWHIHITRA